MILFGMSETRVSVDSQRISVEHLTLHDPSLAAFVNETPQADRGALVERALRIGLLAVCNANATLNVDVVKAEFGRLVTDMAAKQAEAAQALELRCARTSPMVTVASPASWRRTSATRASSTASSATCSTRAVATPRSAGCGSCWADTSTATPRSSPCCSTRPARAARSTSSAPR